VEAVTILTDSLKPATFPTGAECAGAAIDASAKTPAILFNLCFNTMIDLFLCGGQE
jgi:hypothetical protein